jgi:hypothetical protein
MGVAHAQKISFHGESPTLENIQKWPKNTCFDSKMAIFWPFLMEIILTHINGIYIKDRD